MIPGQSHCDGITWQAAQPFAHAWQCRSTRCSSRPTSRQQQKSVIVRRQQPRQNALQSAALARSVRGVPVRKHALFPKCSRHCSSTVSSDMQKRELLIGDVTCLLVFCLYKQITAIMLMRDFPGVLEPLDFNPVRFEEFTAFTGSLIGAWLGCAYLLGAYKPEATADIQTAATRVVAAWAVAMPVAASQLVLTVAAEDRALVGAVGWAATLPLAASGPGEPFTSAAGVLGVMAIWRCFYTAYVDIWNFRTGNGAHVNRDRDSAVFKEALAAAGLLAVCFSIAVVLLFHSVSEEAVQEAVSMMW